MQSRSLDQHKEGSRMNIPCLPRPGSPSQTRLLTGWHLGFQQPSGGHCSKGGGRSRRLTSLESKFKYKGKLCRTGTGCTAPHSLGAAGDDELAPTAQRTELDTGCKRTVHLGELFAPSAEAPAPPQHPSTASRRATALGESASPTKGGRCGSTLTESQV